VNKNNTDTVEIKGQLYDANSGAPINVASVTQPSPPEQEVVSTAPSNQRPPVNQAAPHVPKTSQLLMRSAVKRPDPSLKRRIKISESTDKAIAAPPTATASSLVKLNVQHPGRSQRAAMLKQSDRISHLFVAPHEIPAVQATQPVAATPPPQISTSPPVQQRPSQTTNPQQLPVKSGKSTWRQASWAAAPTVVVLALLIFGGQAFTNLQLRIASAKAGFTTNLPSYRPVGFTLDQMNYNSGIFASDFYTKTGNQSYTITQKSTSWNTQDLLNNYVKLLSPNYKVIQLGTRTIYFYGKGNAAWVSSNIWYQIDSDGSLSESQLIDIANSL